LDIVVCVKQVPDVSEAELRIDEAGKDIKKEELVFDINEWDDYALEEALLMKERYGGLVTAITLGPPAAEETLRKCLAKGCDAAVRLYDDTFKGCDAYATAKILAAAIKALDLKYDLILTGAQASDDGYAAVGPALAQLLDIPYATLVKKVEVLSDRNAVKVHRELDGGLEEVLELDLPALLTIQTGINEPRYVSIMGIKRSARRGVKVVGLKELGLREEEVGEAGSWLKTLRAYLPATEVKTVFLKGSPEEVASKIVSILKERGLM
jgi:electron transfer flavoprotein beta subunit